MERTELVTRVIRLQNPDNHNFLFHDVTFGWDEVLINAHFQYVKKINK